MKNRESHFGFSYIKKYGKFWSISLGHFIKHKPLISEECFIIGQLPGILLGLKVSSKHLLNKNLAFLDGGEYETCVVSTWLSFVG